MNWKHIISFGYLIIAASVAGAQGLAGGVSAELPDGLVPSAGIGTSHEVRLERQGGTYAVPVVINRAITLKFVLDSGASDVLIPADVFLTLLRTGTVSENDFLGGVIYSLADGSKLKGTRFIIRELRVGDQVANNVVASVGPVSGDLLLGLSFLSRFGTVTLDNERHVLILSDKGSVQPRSQRQGDDQAALSIPAKPKDLPGGYQGHVQPTPGREQERYTATKCGSIIDRSMRLEWFIGPDSNTTWSDALKWVRELHACEGNWAMPNISQLKALFDPSRTAGSGYYTRGRFWPAHIDPVFSQIGSGSWVWAGETLDAEGAPAFNFNQGIAVRLSPTNREYTVRAFAVRHATE